MVKVIHVARACLAVGAFSFLSQIPAAAQAENLCWRAWHAQAEKTAELGLRLLHSGNSADRVRLWRLLELGEEAPNGRRDLDLPGKWRGTEQDVRNAYDFMAGESAARGVGWTVSRSSYSRADLNVWFAAKLFEERRQLLGDKHPYLKQWLENQQAVFLQGNSTLVDASSEYDGLAAELAADDVHYQRAALLFYSEDYSAAADSFHAIAAQPASRYRSIAAYMAARSLVHAERFGDALTEIAAIESKSEFEDVRIIAQQLLGVVSWNRWEHYDSSQDAMEAGRRLLLAGGQVMRQLPERFESDPTARKQYWQAVYDLQFFLLSDGSRLWTRGELDDDWWLSPSASDRASARRTAVARAAAEDDLIDWLESTEQVRMLASGPWLAYWSDRTVSSAFRNAEDHVRQRAEESGSLAWALADAMRARGSREIARTALYNITNKLADCSASRAELLTLGPLRYHAARMNLIGGYEGRFWQQSRSFDIGELDKLDLKSRVEATRFLLPLSGTPSQFPAPYKEDAGIDRLLSRTLSEFMAAREQYASSDASAAVLNMMPARVLLQLANDETLAEGIRAALVRNAWTRAYLLRDEAVLKPATELLPKLNPGMSDLIDDYRGAWTEAGRKQAALRLLLKAPTMQLLLPPWSDLAFSPNRSDWRGQVTTGSWSWFLSPAESTKEAISLFWTDGWNPNDGNWWCRSDVVRLQAQLEEDFYNKPLALVPDNPWYSRNARDYVAYPVAMQQYLNDQRRDFLIAHPVLTMIDWEELGKLSKVPAAPEYLANEVVAWVKGAGWFDRWLYGDEMAEALALSVRATRYGCHRDGPNNRHSYAAFQLLHELFPNSAAAEHTPYWYK